MGDAQGNPDYIGGLNCSRKLVLWCSERSVFYKD